MADHGFEREPVERFLRYSEWPPEKDGRVHNTGLTMADYDGDGHLDVLFNRGG